MKARSPLAFTRRRLFGAALGAVGLAGPTVAAAGPARARRRLTLLETYVAGTAYYEARHVRGALRPGEALVLRREPDNAYDDLAIEVFTSAGAKLGYVPRADNEPLRHAARRGRGGEGLGHRRGSRPLRRHPHSSDASARLT